MSDQCHFKNIEAFVAHEEIFLNGVFGVLSQVSFQNMTTYLQSILILTSLTTLYIFFKKCSKSVLPTLSNSFEIFHLGN